jgi:hypothetical protein
VAHPDWVMNEFNEMTLATFELTKLTASPGNTKIEKLSGFNVEK